MSGDSGQPPDYNPTAWDLIPKQQCPGQIATVTPDDTIRSAFTTMILYDYSQLPVVSNDKVVGVVKWNALATAYCSGIAADAKVSDHQEAPQKLYYNDPWEIAVEIVAKGDYAIVVAKDGTLAGIVTASDMAVHLHSLVEPLANIQQIEKALRSINNWHSDNGGKVPSIGEQIEKLNRRWPTLHTGLDCDTVIRALERVKDVRDNIAHFKPQSISESDRENLKRCAAMLECLLKLNNRNSSGNEAGTV